MLAGIVGAVMFFLYVISQALTPRPAEASQVQARAYAIRRWFFVALIVLGIGVTGRHAGAVSHSGPARVI